MCPSCSRHLVEIEVRFGDLDVTMHACSSCDSRWWDHEGRRMALGAVLALASARS